MADIIANGARLEFSQAVQFFRSKLNVPTTHWTDVWKEAHAHGFMVAGAASEALVQDFRAAVDRAIKEGTTLVQFRDEFDSIVKLHGWQHTGSAGWRAKIIYETNLAMAYSAGQYAQLTDPDIRRNYPYWRYVHGLFARPARPRPQHVAWNGLVLSCDDPFWDTHFPPNGWRCTCGVEPVSREELEASGRQPDASPQIKTRAWRNPRTGQVEQVPDGIDPGFDYNPGKAWKTGRGRPDPLDHPFGQPPGLPPAPALPSMPGDLPLDAAVPIPAPAGTPQPAPARLDVTQWIDWQLQHGKADGTARVVGRLPSAVATDAGLPRGVMLSSRRLVHLARDTKQAGGRAIPELDLRNLPAHLAQPDAVLRDKRDGTILLVWRSPEAPGQWIKVAIALGGRVKLAGQKHQTTIIKSAGLALPSNLSSGEYELLDGSLDEPAATNPDADAGDDGGGDDE